MSFETLTVTVCVKSHPEHGLGFSIRGGTDFPHIPSDSGIFITRVRKDTQEFLEGARLLEVDGQSLINVTHGEAVSIIQRAKDERNEYVELKFEKGALDKIEHDQREKIKRNNRILRILISLACIAGLWNLCYLAYKHELPGKVENFIQSRTISTLDTFSFVLSCLALVLMWVNEQKEFIMEHKQLEEENTVLDNLLKQERRLLEMVLSKEHQGRISKVNKQLQTQCEKQRKQLNSLTQVNSKLGDSILFQNRQVEMSCPVCYSLRELPEFNLLNPCGHFLCSSCFPQLPNNLCPTCRTFIYEAIQIYPN